MGKRAGTATKEFLIKAPLPIYEGNTYTVIPHEFVMKETITNLKSQGFEIKEELYRCNMNADIAQGIYHLNYSNDPDLGMMFAWSNSYDKSMRFKCAIGGYVFICSNGMVRGDMGSWGRKHTGSADEETIKTIHEQISGAKIYYNQLVYDKETMKTIILSDKDRAQLVGRLYFEEELLNTEQLTVIKHQFNTPKYDYNADKNSLWSLYNHITLSLHKAHPKDWLDHQRLVHWFFTEEYGIKPLILSEAEQDELTGKNQQPVENKLPEQVITTEVPVAVEEPTQQVPVYKQLDLVEESEKLSEENNENLNHL